MSIPKKENGWEKFEKMVLFQLTDLAKQHENLYEKVDDAKTDFSDKLDLAKTAIIKEVNDLKIKVAQMETRMKLTGGMYGAIGGAVLSIIVSFIIQSLSE